MTAGNNSTDKSKLGTKRYFLTDKKGIPISVVISPASTHDINLVTDVVDDVVIKRPKSSSKSKSTSRIRNARRKRLLQHLCLDKGYKSAQEEKELIKRGYVLYILIKKKRKGKVEGEEGEEEVKVVSFRKNNLRWVVERTNS